MVAESTRIYRQMQFAQRRAELAGEATRVLADAQRIANELVALRSETEAEIAKGETGVLDALDRDELLDAAGGFKARIEGEVLPALTTAIAT